ncbi:hypothetical protein CICLE_v10007062mg, partial [Citrus x clementina]
MERTHCLSKITVSLTHSMLICLVAAASKNITTDQKALLAPKDHITYAPTNLLTQNWTSNTSVCTGISITCDVNSHEVAALDISQFNLQGTIIPNTTGNLRNLKWLGLAYKLLDIFNFKIELSFLFGKLQKIKNLRLTGNPLDRILSGSIGEIPHEIGYLPNLENLVLGFNNLVGVVPAAIFNMSTVKKIYLLDNSLLGSFSLGIDLSLPNVERLNPGLNRFSGTIPSFITNASKLKLRFLGLTGNPLDGVLPTSIGNLSMSLENIYISNCNIGGSIPQLISNLSNLLLLDLEGNKLTGSIPVTFSRLQKLQGLYLPFNKLAGSIPDQLCHLARLNTLGLAGNKFSGSIPSCLGNLTSLRSPDLGSNRLTSVLPSTFWNLKDILFFDLSSNSLDGPLSLDIGNLRVVIGINLSRNNFSGDIPSTIGDLKDLQNISLACNGLEGLIPESFGYLTELNLSFNKLEGEIPRGGPFANFTAKSFMGNEKLCGLPNLQFPKCKRRTRRKSKKKMLLLVIVLPLSTALIIAVPLALKYKSIRGGKSMFHQNCAMALKSFEAECEVMKNIRHRNHVKRISSCSNEDFKALLNIMIDVASALEYLHFSHSTPVIHCDLKPKNVLLDKNMVAHFKTLVTIGYMAPEGRVSTRSDVYSYGIMLIETFTRKKPTDEMFTTELSLKLWVNNLLPASLMEV